MKLPNSKKAVVEIEKLKGYSLNADHPRGKHKARVFKAALGVGSDDAEWLRQQALGVAATQDAIPAVRSPFGSKYVIDANISFKGRSAIVRFSWIIEFGTDFPRLTSCYVK